VVSVSKKFFIHSLILQGAIMANEFSKEEGVAFEQVLEGFEDALVLSKNVSKYNTDQTAMERQKDVIWRPMPYVARSFDGPDATGLFGSQTQLSVPATIGFHKFSPLSLTSQELRDALQEESLGAAARQKLASDINVAVMNVASLQGTLVVKRTAAASGFDDVAQCEAIMNEQGVGSFDRYLALGTRDYNSMASNLASRETVSGKVVSAYEKAFVGQVASFDTFKLDYSVRLAAAAGGGAITIDTTDGASDYTPVATRTAATGESSNIDNRYQVVTVSSTTSVAAGDCFTIAGLNSVHHITKIDTGQLKTFRVISVDSGTTMTISPPIITNQVASDATAQRQNCVINTKAANSAIVFLNTVAAPVNPFWHKDAIEILPGRCPVPTGAGVSVMRGTSEQGLEVVMQKFYDINTMLTKFRWDVRFGVVNKQPEMTGLMLFNQT
jgi:hypothetical protein